MTVMLRTVLIIASILTLLLIMKRIRQAKMQIEDSIFWMGFSIMLIVFSVFPGIVYYLSALVGTMAPSNFIFLFIIFIMLIKIFAISIRMSNLESKIKDLTQEQALTKQEWLDYMEEIHEEQKDQQNT